MVVTTGNWTAISVEVECFSKMISCFQPQPVTEGYQYSELSPNRSPTGPTYTQLSATGSRQTSTYTPTSAQPGSGKLSLSSYPAHFPVVESTLFAPSQHLPEVLECDAAGCRPGCPRCLLGRGQHNHPIASHGRPHQQVRGPPEEEEAAMTAPVQEREREMWDCEVFTPMLVAIVLVVVFCMTVFFRL